MVSQRSILTILPAPLGSPFAPLRGGMPRKRGKDAHRRLARSRALRTTRASLRFASVPQ
jgi:hypothetical protein